MQFTHLERAVLAWIAARASSPELRAQLLAVAPIAREHTGKGSYTELAVPSHWVRVPESSMPAGRARGPVSGPDLEDPLIENCGGSLLWFEEGVVSCLEMFACGSRFPDDAPNAVLLDPSGEPG